jgi:hypothetical protein
VRLIDAEIAVRRLIDPHFDDKLELVKMLENERKRVKRIVGPDPSKR